MPNRDGTGPCGEGPKTGRQMGDCEGAKPTRGVGRGLENNRPRRFLNRRNNR